MTLLDPIWLLLAVPLGASLWLWRLPSQSVLAVRCLVLLLVLLGLAGLAVYLPGRAGTVVVVADRSLSMPPDSETAQKEAIDLMQRAMHADERLAVVSFGQRAALEHSPQAGKFASFVNEVGRDASNLTEALEAALALVPAGDAGKVVILSDGKWTGRNPA